MNASVTRFNPLAAKGAIRHRKIVMSMIAEGEDGFRQIIARILESKNIKGDLKFRA